MGWGAKGKGKAVEHALHRAERQEEWAADYALAHGDIAGAAKHWQNADALANAEEAVHFSRKGKGKGKGKGHWNEGYSVPAEVVVLPSVPVAMPVVTASPVTVIKGAGKGVERALRNEERFEQASAGASLACGDVVGAQIHAARASELHAAGETVHKDVVRAQARHAHHVERREEHLAARDLAHGNIFGAISHELRAVEAHRKEERLEAELIHDRWDKGKGKGWGKGWGKGKDWW